MSEAAAVIAVPPEDKRPQVETLLTDVFRLMDVSMHYYFYYNYRSLYYD